MSSKWKTDILIIDEIVNNLKDNKYQILLHNDKNGKNQSFRIKWKRDPEKIKQMVKLISREDYQYSIESEDKKLSIKILHIFKHDYLIPNAFFETKEVTVYIKIGVFDEKNLLVVSFHEDG